MDPVTFQQSGFSGLAEFLEVRFDRDANLSRTYFKLGTGFSGSQFAGLADFSEALFDGDAFFTFTRFDGDAYFRRATFRATADFDDAQFNGREDFSKVFFEKGPQFCENEAVGQTPKMLGHREPTNPICHHPLPPVVQRPADRLSEFDPGDLLTTTNSQALAQSPPKLV